MKRFRYRAKKGSAETIEGVLTGESKEDVIEHINQMGLLAVDVSEEKEIAVKKEKIKVKGSFFQHVNSRELSVFYRQLAKLLKSGIPILRAFTIINEEVENQYFHSLLESIHSEIKEGNPLSVAMSRYPNVFSSYDIAMIQTGENIGQMDQSLARLVRYLEERDTVRSKVRTALAYPTFITIMGFISVFVMLRFVIPKFATFFQDLGQQLPLATRILLSLSDWVQGGWVWFVVGGVGFYWLVRRAMKSESERLMIDTFLLKIPKYGTFIRKVEISNLSRALALQIRNGVNMLHALRISIPVVGNHAIRNDFKKCLEVLQEGGYFTDGLRASSNIPSFFVHLVKIGEESGHLDETLVEVADWYEKDVTESIQVFTNLLEPLLILAVAFILGLIIIAVLLPVFSMEAFV